MCQMARIRTNFNTEVIVADMKKEFINAQQYDVICVHGMEELERGQSRTALYREVMDKGQVLYRRE